MGSEMCIRDSAQAINNKIFNESFGFVPDTHIVFIAVVRDLLVITEFYGSHDYALPGGYIPNGKTQLSDHCSGMPYCGFY